MSDSEIVPGGPPPAQPNTFNSHAATGATLLPGMPCYSPAGGGLAPARANAAGTAYAPQLALYPASNGEKVGARYSGPLTLTSAQWAAVLNTGTELTPGVPYYVSQAAAGKITLTEPGSGIVFCVGYALSELCMMIAPCLVDSGGG